MYEKSPGGVAGQVYLGNPECKRERSTERKIAMRRVLCCALLLFVTATTHADWVYLRDLDRGEIPNEFHPNITNVHLTRTHVRPGHVALAFRPVGKGWVTRYNLRHNWTCYDRVAFRMFNANNQPVTFTWEVRTRHGRRANTRVTVQPGANDVVLKFADFTNIAKKPLSLYEVSQWVMFFDEALSKPLYLSEYRLIRENIEIPWPTETSIEKQWKTENTTLTSDKEDGDPVPVFWASATYPAGKTGCVWVDLRPGERRFNTFAPISTWLGYDRITFACDNPQAAPVTFEVLLEDFATIACRDTQYREGQAAAVPVTARVGKHVVTVSLKDLRTADGKRWLDLSYVARIGFRVKAPEAATRLRFTDIRIHTTDEHAGLLIPVDRTRKCTRCGKYLDDVNCIACPFCGMFYNEKSVVTPAAPASVRLFPVKEGSVMASSGGGAPTVDRAYNKRASLSVCHYDARFGGRRGIWEGRAFLRFDPSTLPVEKRIRKAELRIRRIRGKKPPQNKSWLCPVRVFVAPDGKGAFDEKTLSWITQPPVGSFTAQGGLYYYWTDAMALDVTEFVRARLAKTRKPFTLILRAFEAESYKEDPHRFGHFLPFHSRKAQDEALRPHLYVEFE